MKAKTPPFPTPKKDPNKSPASSSVNSDKRATHNSLISSAHSGLSKHAGKK